MAMFTQWFGWTSCESEFLFCFTFHRMHRWLMRELMAYEVAKWICTLQILLFRYRNSGKIHSATTLAALIWYAAEFREYAMFSFLVALCLFQLCMQCMLHQFSYNNSFFVSGCRCYVWRCCDSCVTFVKSTLDAFWKCLQHGKNIKSSERLRQHGFDNFFSSYICVFVWHFSSHFQYETHWILHDFISSVTLVLFVECSKRHDCSKQ